MNTILLGIIAVSEITRLLMTHWPQSKKSHFKGKLDATTKMVYDLEFKKFKTQEIREDVRREYDAMKARIDTLDAQIKGWPKDRSIDERKRLEDDKVRAERDVARFEQQMVGLDAEIDGIKPSKDYPDGVAGISHQIDSLRELQSMLKSWIKSL